jgi:hypothetical protein
VWTAIQTQQHEQAKQKAAAQQQKKAKRSTKRISKRSISVPLPPPKVPMPTAKPKQPPRQKTAPPTQLNANPHLNPQVKVPYPPTIAATPNAKAANVAKQVSDVDDNNAANTSTSAQPTHSQRVPTLPSKNALLAQKKGIAAFKRA